MLEYCPYYDADLQQKVKSELGEDKLLVFNIFTGSVYVAEKTDDRFVIDIGFSQPFLNTTIIDMEEGNWQLKTS